MAKSKKAETGSEMLPTAPNEKIGFDLAQINTEGFDAAMEALEKKPDNELIEVSSDLLKMTDGEVFNGIITNQIEEMEGDDGVFKCVVLYSSKKEKTLCADAVVISQAEKMFKDVDPAQVAFKPVRLICEGMKQSSKDSKRQYRNIRVFTL